MVIVENKIMQNGGNMYERKALCGQSSKVQRRETGW